VHSQAVRDHAKRLRDGGLTLSEVSRRLGVSRSSLRSWEQRGTRVRARPCPTCDATPLDEKAYSALLGFYLGDGCLSAARRTYSLRITCDAGQPRVIDDVTRSLVAVRPGPVFYVQAPGCIVATAHWRHWPCLFPQHGPGRKHERPIVLDEWQRRIVEAHPGPFLRGLFHSDGSRVNNWARRPVAGRLKRYEYPRWQFSNTSADIRELCCWALDLVDIAWRQSSRVHISVSRREAVAALDELIGPKT
jgi:hypothetical protein